ncbi:MAG: hypothetical protein EZS28_047812, partial [Streblomastix strix]
FEATLQAMNIKCLKILSDNSTACFCLMRKRAAFSIHKQIDRILATLEQNGLIIKVKHIKGLDNKEPDALSKLARAGDYQIKSDVLMKVLQQWHISITLDAFASRRNAKHKSWKGELPLLHLPIPLISRVIQKVIKERITAIFITPQWTSQPWWSQLKGISMMNLTLGQSEENLIPGPRMKKMQWKLLQGKIMISLVRGVNLEKLSSNNAYKNLGQPLDLLITQYMHGEGNGDVTRAPFHLSSNIGNNKEKQQNSQQKLKNHIQQQQITYQ